MTTQCVFCSIAAKESPADIVHEDDHVVAVEDIQPNAPVHVLVFPKSHHPSLDALSDDGLLGRIVSVGKRLGEERSPELGYRLMINSEKQADIPHLHLHVLGGLQKGDSPNSRGGD